MNYFVNEIGEVFAFELGMSTPDGLRVISATEAMALAASPEPSLNLDVIEREWRDADLVAIAWLRDRHRDQREIEALTTLSAEQFRELLVYMQALRDWPQSHDFPIRGQRPTPPAWIAEQLE